MVEACTIFGPATTGFLVERTSLLLLLFWSLSWLGLCHPCTTFCVKILGVVRMVGVFLELFVGGSWLYSFFAVRERTD